MARDDFEGQEGGGGISDFDFTVTDAYFAPVESYAAQGGGDVHFLHLVGESDVEGREIMGPEDFHPSFSLAEHWVSVDGGKTVKTDKGGKPKMGKYYGRFCTRVLELTENIAETEQDPLRGDRHPSDASIWIGTKWHFDNETFDFGSFGKKEHLMPTAYLGMVDVSSSAPAASTSAPAAAATDSGDSGLRATVMNLAKSLPNYQAFQQAALNVPGVSDDISLLTEVADEANGIWAKAQS